MAAPGSIRIQHLTELTTFVGRGAELDEIRGGLSSSRLVTLTGVGGVGKTRLAIRTGWNLRRLFPDGVWVAELAGLDDGELLAQAVVSSLGIQDTSTRWNATTLAARLAGQRLLLILDNCEHLLEACAELVTTLLHNCPDLNVLVTSRQALGIGGERVYPVCPLRLPPDDVPRTPQVLRGFEAITLFEDRAATAVPHFAVNEGNSSAVSGLCRRLDGIPLAIELAAASVRVLSPEQLLRRLDDRFNMLTSGSRASLPRHQTLQASIDWSFDLCTEQERLLWARASVFVESFTLEAAEAVCADAELPRAQVLNAVTGLLDKSVIVRDERETGVRYRLLESIRQYGHAVLQASADEQALQQRHRDWYLELAEDTHRHWFGPEQAACIATMRAEQANIRAALEYCLSTPDISHAGLRIADACHDLWRVGGLTSEGRAWFDRLLTHDQVPSAPRARALTSASYLALLHSDLPAATQILRENRELAGELHDETLAMLHKVPEALAAMERQDFLQAVTLCEEFTAWQPSDDLEWRTTALVLLGSSHTVRGEQEQARRRLQKLLDVCEKHQETWRRAYALWGLGLVAWREGDYKHAEALERACLATQRGFHDQFCAVVCLEAMSWIAISTGRHKDGARLAGAAHGLRRESLSPLVPYLTGYRDRCEEQARRALGEKTYTGLFDEGARLTFGQVARQLLGDNSAPKPSSRNGPGEQLTKREREVAGLVARGMSNKQIAQALVISQRTAETHVEHILTKLGFNSRSQIAALSLEPHDKTPTPRKT